MSLRAISIIAVSIAAMTSAVMILILGWGSSAGSLIVSVENVKSHQGKSASEILVAIENDSSDSIAVNCNWDCYSGLIYLMDDTGWMQIIQDARYYTQLRTGPQSSEVRVIGKNEKFEWRISSSNFVDVGGVPIVLEYRPNLKAFCVPEGWSIDRKGESGKVISIVTGEQNGGWGD